MTLHTGEILDGKYRIIRQLGAGAMGAVYEGENVRIRRRVAIKVLLPAVAQHADTVQRFEREAQAAGRIGSDHIVEVLDLGTMPDGGFYMVMEFLEGQTLRDRIKMRGRLAPRELVPIVQQLLFGLEMAHEARIIHRDLKPDNVFLVREHAGQRDFVKILDFGVSKFNPLNVEEGMSMTRTGTVVGTPFYMAPEQAKGAREIDSRSDLYSVGVILYEAVSGQVPFHAGTFNELIFKIVLETPPPVEAFVPDIDQAFSRIIRRAMAREPGERYGNAAEFRDALSIWLHTGRDSLESERNPPPPVGSGLDWDDDQMPTMMAQPGELGGATQLVAPEDGAATRVAAPTDDQLATRVVAPSQPPAASQRKPPPRRRTAPLPTQPLEQQAPVLAPPVAPAAMMAPALSPHPGPAAAMMVPALSPYPGAAAMMAMPAPAVPTYQPQPSLSTSAPTPVGLQRPHADAFREEDPWPVAGVPRQRTGMLPLIAGVVATVAVGAVAAILVLSPGDDESAAAATAAEVDEADRRGSEETASASAGGEDDTAQEDEPAGASGEPAEAEPPAATAETSETSAVAVATSPPPPPPPRATAPKSPPPATPPPPPPPPTATTPPPKPTASGKKGTGRKIQTEL